MTLNIENYIRHLMMFNSVFFKHPTSKKDTVRINEKITPLTSVNSLKEEIKKKLPITKGLTCFIGDKNGSIVLAVLDGYEFLERNKIQLVNGLIKESVHEKLKEQGKKQYEMANAKLT